jgi:hypothetical protein
VTATPSLQERDQAYAHPERLRRCGVPKTEGTCRDILKRREALWTFVQVEGVEPTNNAAEVRSVDQKPSFQLGGLVPRCKGGNSR